MSVARIALIVVVIVVVIVGVLGGAWFYFMRRWDSEQPSKKDILRPSTSKIAGKPLVIYHPGFTGYTEEVAYEIGKALQTKG